ncbi:hypothetical protein EXN22_03745 [Pseudomonas tructae]|uniref:Dermonecrotic toxin N-terminal domain-containing protein n=1 Tax=Pseudomonas tructae TaxID=2518644 RepID=A0A411MDL9_9PSED|nr:DUF6543 domain-containing protein [Pseudomonas tructae]QBF24850.1 hypothetical protein EXN22_03745 [Pseudomonas tructae]
MTQAHIRTTTATERDELEAVGQRFAQAYPDIHEQLVRVGSELLHQHTGQVLDPQQVYWHRFTDALSSSRTYSGWAHVGRPEESLTFVQLLMQRFRDRDQDNADELQVYGGFYLADANAGFFDERNEVRLLPQVVMKAFWDLDFAASYRAALDGFWNSHSNDFQTLARAAYLASAAEAYGFGALTYSDLRSVLRAIGREKLESLAQVAQPAPAMASVTVQPLVLDGVQSLDGLRIIAEDGREVLYLPGGRLAFQGFANERVLQSWLQSRLARDDWRAALIAHFAREHRQRMSREQTLNVGAGEAVVGDLFVALSQTARAEMERDSQLLLTSNAQLRKRLWIGYLDAFISLASATALLSWPIALIAVGAGLANVGLNIDQAITGATSEQRKAGVVGAALNSIGVLFNAAGLLGVAEAPVEIELGNNSGAGHLVEVLPSSPEPAGKTWSPIPDTFEQLKGLEANVMFSRKRPILSGALRGAFLQSDGNPHIQLDNETYQVRYNSALNVVEIVPPGRPYDFFGARPVRQLESGRWVLLQRPLLRGGDETAEEIIEQLLPGEGGRFVLGAYEFPSAQADTLKMLLATTLRSDARCPEALDIYLRPGRLHPFPQPQQATSEFWNRYIPPDVEGQKAYAQEALARQKRVVEVQRLSPDAEVIDDYYLDMDGREHRVFIDAQGEYKSQSILHYTDYDEDFNGFLRRGTQQPDDPLKRILDLAEELEVIGTNDEVALYRGGFGSRGTSGMAFRSGRLQVGNVLVNSDITSFSESPYVARRFASSQGGDAANDSLAPEFDNTSVIFRIDAEQSFSAYPVAPFSRTPLEVESVFLPGCYFKISSLKEVSGPQYRFMEVGLEEVSRPQAGNVFDLRTGNLFNREQYLEMLGANARDLVDKFFPL